MPIVPLVILGIVPWATISFCENDANDRGTDRYREHEDRRTIARCSDGSEYGIRVHPTKIMAVPIILVIGHVDDHAFPHHAGGRNCAVLTDVATVTMPSKPWRARTAY